MSPIKKHILERKLDSIRTNLGDIGIVFKKGLDSYLLHSFDKKVMERSLQILIEAVIDINLHILKADFSKTPEDSAASFQELASCGVLTLDLAQSLAPSVGLRNRIVHEYDELDAEKIFESAGKALKLYPDYMRAILAYLEK